MLEIIIFGVKSDIPQESKYNCFCYRTRVQVTATNDCLMLAAVTVVAFAFRSPNAALATPPPQPPLGPDSEI